MISVGITVVRSENPEEDRLNNLMVDFLRVKRSTSGDTDEYMDFIDFTKEEQEYIIKCLSKIVDTYKLPTAEEIKESFSKVK